ncbi:SpaH/EbpB family LPXTG-anchored major pilin [Anaerococcus lactolyticus]|uniref:SpaH/EbpB family LPXTG-anchored major pilin n=1 Tax=Anaerococcus lactolyticus TaxID=33032 RepID=UPI00288A4DEB|nr:SpaH/EbpB family LPXTG-anchored major pilin [Anaerococcus lactolyticus]
MKKKILSLLTAFAMVFGILVAPFTSASASNANEPLPEGKIGQDVVSTTKPPKTKLYVHKLQASSFNSKVPANHNGGILDLITPAGSGNTQTDNIIGTNVKPLDGVKFKYYKVTDAQLKTLKDDKTGKNTKEDDIKGLLNVNSLTGTEGITKTVGNDKGVLTVNGQVLELEEGNYWFIETGYDKTKAGTDAPDNISSYIAVPFGITLPLTNVTEVEKDGKKYQPGTVWLKEVHTYPKNVTGKESIPKKTVGNEKNISETYEVGKEQTWYLQATVPANIKDYESITMRDVFFKGLTYKGLEEVYFGFDGMDENDKVKLGTDDYTLTQPTVDTKFTTEIPNPVKVPEQAPSGEEFKLVLKEGSDTNKIGTIKIAEKYEEMKKKAEAKGEKDVKIYAKVKTVINEDAKISTKIPNTFDLKVKIKGQPESKPKEPDEKPNVKTGGKKFKKYDETNKKVLEDAVFTIKHKVGGETAPTDWSGADIKDLVWTDALIAANKDAIEAGRFALKDTTKEEYKATDSNNKPTAGSTIYIRSGNDGLFEIKGLEYSEYSITYWDKTTKTFKNAYKVYNHYALKEVKAPQDYALLDKEIGFTVNDTSYFAQADKVDAPAADPLVVNNKKLTIPQTGGIGSVIFIVAGIAIMTFAFVAYRKSQAKEA